MTDIADIIGISKASVCIPLSMKIWVWNLLVPSGCHTVLHLCRKKPRKKVAKSEKNFYLHSEGLKRSNRCWVSLSEKREEIFKTTTFDPKMMVIIAIRFYWEIPFRNPSQEWTDKQWTLCHSPQSRMKNFSWHMQKLTWKSAVLVEDNACPHAAANTQNLLERKKVTLLHQPPYSIHRFQIYWTDLRLLV